MEELAYEMGLTMNQLYVVFVVNGIITALFLHYVYFPIEEKYGKQIDKYFPSVYIAGTLLFFLYMGLYMIVALLIVWAAFIKIVLNSDKYPKLNRIFDSLF